MVYPPLLPLMHAPRLPVVDWTDASDDLNGLVRFAGRRNLISARVPSHFNWPLIPNPVVASILSQYHSPSILKDCISDTFSFCLPLVLCHFQLVVLQQVSLRLVTYCLTVIMVVKNILVWSWPIGEYLSFKMRFEFSKPGIRQLFQFTCSAML